MGIPTDEEINKQSQEEADALEIGAPVDDDEDILESPPETREQKKRNRYREQIERADRAERLAQEASERQKLLEQELLQQRQYLQQVATQQQRQPQADPLEQDLGKLRESRRSLEIEYEREVERYQRERRQMPREEYQKFVDRAEKLDEERVALIAEKRAMARQPDPNQQAIAAMQRIMAAENNDVYGNERALFWARGRYAQYQADGHNDSRELHDRVMEEARERFGMKPRSSTRAAARDDDERRQKYVGAGRGAAMAPSGERQKFVMNDLHKQIADERYAYIQDPRQRYQKYANEVGAKLVGKK